MAKELKVRKNGGPDGRGHGEGSRASQFASGDGRKRPGRAKGAKSLATIYREVAEMPVALTIGDKRRRISTKEAIILKQRDKAMKGEDRPMERFLERVDQFSPPEVQANLTAALLEEDAQLLAAALGRGAIGWAWPEETASQPNTGNGEPRDPSTEREGDA